MPQSPVIKDDKTLILGNKPEKIDFSRENVRVVLYDPKTDLFAVQYMKTWNKYGLLGGGVEKNHTILETVKKELVEESGFTDFEIQAQLGGKIFCYFSTISQGLDDKRWSGSQERISTGFLVILKSQKSIPTQLEDYEIEIGSKLVWLPQEKVLEHLKTQTEKEFNWSYHLEVFQRALKVLGKL